MFDKLDGILERYDEIMEQLNDPNVVSDQNNFRKLMKEQGEIDLAGIDFPACIKGL